MSLKGKHALVTGSTSGIGLGIAEGLAQEGVHLVLNGFGEAHEIEALRQRLASDYGVKVIYDGADMSQGADIARMMIEVADKTGGLDIVVNNAGIQHVSPVEDFPEAKFVNQKLTIHPEEGKTVLFPAGFTHKHCGVTSDTCDKVIFTGWFQYSNRM